MPTTKSAKKRHRQSEKRRLANRAVKSELKTRLRKVRDLVKAGSLQEAGEALRVATKRLDQAASKGIVHENKSSRLKSRLAKFYKTAGGKAAASK